LPETTIESKPAVGLKVSSKGREDVKLFFDKARHWLVAAQRRGNVGGQAVDRSIASRHKNIDGGRAATRYLESRHKTSSIYRRSLTSSRSELKTT